MTYSPLITETMPPKRQWYGDKWSDRPAGVRVNGLIVHHHATTGEGGIARLVSSSDKASANYIIRTNGNLIGSVPEEYRAWTSGSYAADDDKITVEVQNSTGAPEWKVSDEALATLVALYADLAARYGFPPDRAHISGHRDWAATSCPGPYLSPLLGEVAIRARGLTAPVPVPVSNPVPTPAPVPAPTPPRPAVRQIAADGVWGADTTRRLQEYFGTPVDGVISHQWRSKANENIRAAQFDKTRIGSTLGRALQRWAGVTQDGLLGPNTVAAMQRRLGTPVDGFVSPVSTMVREMQQRLNANTL